MSRGSQTIETGEKVAGALLFVDEHIGSPSATTSFRQVPRQIAHKVAADGHRWSSKVSTLPAASAPRAERKPAVSCREANQDGTTARSNIGRSILLAEDDPLVRKHCANALRCAGFEVDAAEDGNAAWELFREKNYDLLMTDNDMPGMSGVELIGRIRRKNNKVPVILISGSTTAAQICSQAGFENWISLPKPFTADSLVASATEVIGCVSNYISFFGL